MFYNNMDIITVVGADSGEIEIIFSPLNIIIPMALLIYLSG